MAKLFEIAERYRNLEELADLVNSGELEEEILVGALTEVEGELGDKLSNITKLIKEMNTDILGIDTEIERLTSRKKRTKNSIERLEEYMFNCMKVAGLKKTSDGLNTWSIAKKPKSVKILNEDKIPEEFMVHKVTTSVNKKALKAALENGEVIEGAEISQGETLRIK